MDIPSSSRLSIINKSSYSPTLKHMLRACRSSVSCYAKKLTDEAPAEWEKLYGKVLKIKSNAGCYKTWADHFGDTAGTLAVYVSDIY
jgi:hypothetical protein